MQRVVCLGTIHQRGLDLLHGRPDLLTLTVADNLTPEGVRDAVAGADAILVRTSLLPAEVLALAPDLKIVSRHGVGTDNIDVAHLSARGIPMAIAVDSNVDSVAEHTMMMILSLAKDSTAGDEAVRLGDFAWRDRRTPRDLTGKTALILGFGRIGRRVAELCLALGMRVLAHDPYTDPGQAGMVEMAADWRAALAQADVVSLHVPSTPETAGMLGREELAALRPGAILVNCARGGIVSEGDLLEALESGTLGAVGLDVFSNEPPDVTHPLFSHPRTLFSPHNAALTEECAMRMAAQAAANIIDCLQGKLQPRVVFNRRELGL